MITRALLGTVPQDDHIIAYLTERLKERAMYQAEAKRIETERLAAAVEAYDANHGVFVRTFNQPLRMRMLRQELADRLRR